MKNLKGEYTTIICKSEYGIKRIKHNKKKYIDRIFILRQHLSGGALWSILRKLLKRKPTPNKMFVYKSRFVESKIVVSVVVPLYNTPQQYLRAMIESVLEQTYPNWELCLADGSDTDEVCQICQEYVNKDSRVKYLKLEKNRGISENTNEAIRLATGG